MPWYNVSPHFLLHRRCSSHSESQYNNLLWDWHVNVRMCVFICWASFEIKGLFWIKIGSAVCLYTLCRWVCLKWRVHIIPLGASFCEDVPLVEFMYFVFTCMPGGVTVGDSGLCCFVPCLSSAVISLCLLILHRRFWPHSVSVYIHQGTLEGGRCRGRQRKCLLDNSKSEHQRPCQNCSPVLFLSDPVGQGTEVNWTELNAGQCLNGSGPLRGLNLLSTSNTSSWATHSFMFSSLAEFPRGFCSTATGIEASSIHRSVS